MNPFDRFNQHVTGTLQMLRYLLLMQETFPHVMVQLNEEQMPIPVAIYCQINVADRPVLALFGSFRKGYPLVRRRTARIRKPVS